MFESGARWGLVGAALIGAMTLSVSAVATSGTAAASDGPVCNWYAINTCSRSRNEAVRGANRYGGLVIRTDNVDGFRAGFWCAVVRSETKTGARRMARTMRRKGSSTAYIKEGCLY
ncbi:MAG: hypothetical protein AAFR55_09580 [Pseudomonadota bacterium]